MRKTFVEFYSPGTFVPETTAIEIGSRDINAAVMMARKVKERHGATPYAFRFYDRVRKFTDFDSHTEKPSALYFLGGKIETLAEVEARNDPKEEILRDNMRCNGIKRVITNTNSWKTTVPFGDDDVLLEFTP